ncbi:MAG: hypothetical protein U1E65_17665 [Myxococcota bacterium]
MLFLLALLAADPPSPAGPFKDWKGFAEARSGECVGPAGTIDPPIPISVGGKRYSLEGHRLVALDKDADDVLRIGVVSALKDSRPETQAALHNLLEALKKRKIDLLVANGDLATTSFDMDVIFKQLAAEDMPVVIFTGNTESCGAFNQAADRVFAERKNLINGNWVRRLELDDGTLITLPGYYDKRFAHTGGAARYNDQDLEDLRDLARGAPGPLILTSHGPPKMEGKGALDVAFDAGNVGDAGMTEAIKDLKISFGIFGHILEAGGRATDLSGKVARAAQKFHPTLYVNAGTGNPDPWKMLDGSTGYGMGMVMEIKPKEARYFVEKLKMVPPSE